MNTKTAIMLCGLDPKIATLCDAIGQEAIGQSEQALTTWFEEGFDAYYARDSTRGNQLGDPDYVRAARSCGYEVAMEQEIED